MKEDDLLWRDLEDRMEERYLEIRLLQYNKPRIVTISAAGKYEF